MKKNLLFFFAVVLLFGTTNFMTVPEKGTITSANVENLIPAELASMSVDAILDLTPAKYKEITGKKLGIKNTLALKAAQKSIKKQALKGGEPGIDKTVYIILAILIPFLAVGLATNFNGSEWLVALLLTFLCWLPGFIYALVKMKKYY